MTCGSHLGLKISQHCSAKLKSSHAGGRPRRSSTACASSTAFSLQISAGGLHPTLLTTSKPNVNGKLKRMFPHTLLSYELLEWSCVDFVFGGLGGSVSGLWNSSPHWAVAAQEEVNRSQSRSGVQKVRSNGIWVLGPSSASLTLMYTKHK